MPNTYVFTKRLAEDVVHDFSEEYKLPCVIIRPSIVISSAKEPVTGWIDNFNGPIGLLVGGAKGILRVVYIDPFTTADFMAVDVAIKCMLITAWQRGINTYVTKSMSFFISTSEMLKKKCVIRIDIHVF